MYKEDKQRGLEEGTEIPQLCNTAAKVALHSEESYGFFKLATKLNRFFLTAALSVATNKWSFRLTKSVKRYTRNKTDEEN